MNEDPVAWRLIVPVKAVPGMAGLADTAVKRDIGKARDFIAAYAQVRRLAISRPQRALRKQRQDVGEQKLLVLLLVIDADLDQPGDLARRINAARGECLQRLVDMGAIGENLVVCRPGQEAALRPRLLW